MPSLHDHSHTHDHPHGHAHTRANMMGLARHPGHYLRWARLLAAPLYRRVVRDVAAAQLPPAAVVLDVGTGPGRVPMMLAERCPGLVVTGLDLSPEMIATANENAERATAGSSGSEGSDEGSAPYGDAGRLSFRVGDVAALPFDDRSVDLVISSLSLHHWEDPATGLREIVRVLKPGAQAWVYDVRPVVTRTPQVVADLPAAVRVESPLTGTLPLNPIGRLVLTRDA